MMKLMVVVLMVGCVESVENSGPPPPSCQQAVGHYYGAGCVFVDGTTGQVIPPGQFTADCQTEAANAPSACLDEFDDFLICINKATSTACDCSRYQMDYLTCH